MCTRLITLLLCALWSSHLWACWNAMRTDSSGVSFQPSQPEMTLLTLLPEDNPAVTQLISSVELSLAKGHHWEAYEMLRTSNLVKLHCWYSYMSPSTHPDVAAIRPDPLIDTDSAELREKFERLVAVIAMRLDKQYASRSLAVLQTQLNHDPQSVYLKARIAEAHSLLKNRRVARSILELLEARDLLPDGEASRLLVCLRQGCKSGSRKRATLLTALSGPLHTDSAYPRECKFCSLINS